MSASSTPVSNPSQSAIHVSIIISTHALQRSLSALSAALLLFMASDAAVNASIAAIYGITAAINGVKPALAGHRAPGTIARYCQYRASHSVCLGWYPLGGLRRDVDSVERLALAVDDRRDRNTRNVNIDEHKVKKESTKSTYNYSKSTETRKKSTYIHFKSRHLKWVKYCGHVLSFFSALCRRPASV